ncbi:hypothetical protein P7C70_g2062, partial [Phenoliferia sp. Uapishka_3]
MGGLESGGNRRTALEESEDNMLGFLMTFVQPLTCRNITQWFDNVNKSSPPSCKLDKPLMFHKRYSLEPSRFTSDGTRLLLSERQASAWINFICDNECQAYFDEVGPAVASLNSMVHGTELTHDEVTVALAFSGHDDSMKHCIIRILGKGEVK